MSMRTAFDFGTRKSLGHWFPRHMGKGMRQMRAVLRKVDCVIEVHDARIPMSGRNPHLQNALSSKPRLLIFNKVDLAKPSDEELERVDRRLQDEGIQDYMFAKCSPGENGSLDKSIEEVVPRCRELIDSNIRYDRETDPAMELLVVGVPNVGKSSLINALRRLHLGLGKGASVAKTPGHTRSLMNKVKVCKSPLMFLHDTPGILEPRITDLDCGMRLALCGSIQDHMIGSAMIADYLLFTLNQKRQYEYVKRYYISQPTDEIQPILHNIALKMKNFQQRTVFTGTGKTKVTIPNYEVAATAMLKDFREGLLGDFIVDDLLCDPTDCDSFTDDCI